MAMTEKDDFQSRIINIVPLVTGESREKEAKIIRLMDSGTQEEKNAINSAGKDWVVFVFECEGDIYGTVIIPKEVSENTCEKISNTLTSYFKRTVPTSEKSDSKCIHRLQEMFPSIFEKSKVCSVYKFS